MVFLLLEEEIIHWIQLRVPIRPEEVQTVSVKSKIDIII